MQTKDKKNIFYVRNDQDFFLVVETKLLKNKPFIEITINKLQGTNVQCQCYL